MCTRRSKVTIFAVLFLFCVSISYTKSGNVIERDLVVSRISTVDYVLEKADDVPSDVEEGMVQQAGCDCKNGHCVRNGKNLDCICDPGFGKIAYTNECQYCDCGFGVNCSFTRGFFDKRLSKKCHCPEGFKENYSSCRAICNETHPCLNGGTCDDGQCRCMSGTHGDFCKGIFWCAYSCRPRLEVDCVYNQDKEYYDCLCKNRSLVFDYDQERCRPCPCGNGTCVRGWLNRLECNCDPGYKEFKQLCKPCICLNGGECSFDNNGQKRCKCPDGFAEREGTCIDCECGLWSKIVKCDLNGNEKNCFCPEGYESRHGKCEEIDECELNTTCHGLKCIKTVGGYKCECEDGYEMVDDRYPEDGCKDINECYGLDKCPSFYQLCVNLPGSYKCVCRDGYQPRNMWSDPQNTSCTQFKESWLPTILSIAVAVILIVVAIAGRKYIDYRSRQRNST